ncbi:acetylhydrolase [Kitasatospora sp. MMS16-BH015]|uniref:alpha/beta hydrolase family protein n=1 Tax=Kitasatospora sp. MMS16-BH015 TaxID=2018025 RepID=UPI000CA36DE9|nr:alpha/beta hydrolase [Kitasatospora sp. MMS16-BH015]AUG80971.1 acetylhydrolase [Kitasatospora sp. MMS16-BH015]
MKTNMVRRAAAAAVLALILPLPLVVAGAAQAAEAAQPKSSATAAPSTQLPKPTGPYAVGRQILHLTDTARTDPWVPAAGARQLMVSMYYPARPGTGGPAPYMTDAAEKAMITFKAPGYPVDPLPQVGTWSHTDARPVGGKYPLVLLSPGFTMPRTEISGLAEDLASRGYVVALVDHTYENSGTTFPDGQTLTCAICDAPPPGGPAVIEQSRAKDMSFVLDELTGPGKRAWGYAHLIDAKRIGMAGHSIGGAATVSTMAADQRVRAGVNLDGTMFDPVPAAGLGGRPFLLMGHPSDLGEDPSWTDGWAHLDGWKRWITFAGSNHSSFTDVPRLAEVLGVPNPPGTTLSTARGEQLTRTYVGAFFDEQLKGEAEPVLDGPSAADPEVSFHS